ncbi:MAG: hypothetical protein HOJ67_01170 [Rhodospirillaceae bacterium]|jgi:hypothetical protein|nr:hypothetical protein [Rhodospirillales bacterium]MBT3906949.1 hypothetical protein [Rhodospirillaceae bacterium]MBT6220902.1 hypothetical protein [Rhodospirillaceae bacterium]MBT6360777.1 hypothetical protein [Rhodospirillaceae bacterium]MBT7769308.1 hypothetical protein [Rhodospirillales bacterium]
MASRGAIIGVVLGAITAAGFVYLALVKSETNAPQASLTIDDNLFQRQKTASNISKPAVVKPSSSTSSRPRNIPPSTPVNSYPVEKSYPLNDWSQNNVSAGHLDSVILDGKNPGLLDKHKLTNNDVLKASGWAGNVFLGMRMRHVFLTVCSKIVGNTLVTGKRPDVVRLAHPNLTTSGWTALLAVAHLPRCKNPVLQAWTVGSVAPVLSPLIGNFPLSLPPANSTPTNKSFQTRSTQVRPDQVPPAPAVTVEIMTDKASIYKCSNKRCRVVGTRGKGQHPALIADELEGWVLFQLHDVSGWMPRNTFRILKRSDEVQPQK